MSIKSRSTAGTPRFPGSALVEHWAMEGSSRGQPKKFKTWEKEQKRRQEGNEQENLFFSLLFLCLLLFSCLKYVLKRPFLPHFVELHWKRSIINKILSSSSPLRWVTKTYRGRWGGGNVTSCPHLRTPHLITSALTLYHPPPPHYYESDKRKPRESVSRFPFCFFFQSQKRLEWSDDGLTSKKWGTERKERVKKRDWLKDIFYAFKNPIEEK